MEEIKKMVILIVINYFDKTKTDYFVIGQVDGDVLLGILERISSLDEQSKLTVNLNNIIEKIEETVE